MCQVTVIVARLCTSGHCCGACHSGCGSSETDKCNRIEVCSLNFKGITGPWDETSSIEHSVTGTNYKYWQVSVRSISATVLCDLHIPVLTWDTPPRDGDTGGCGGCYHQVSGRGRRSYNNNI